MRLKLFVLMFLMLGLASRAFAVNEITIKNAGMSRLISYFGGPLRTSRIEMDGVQLLKQPGVEFQIDLDYKGEPVSLVPRDFEVRGADTAKVRGVNQISLRMQCMQRDLPLVVHVRYHWDPLKIYLQKSIKIEPLKRAAGAIIRRVVIEDLALTPDFEPIPQADAVEDATSTADSGQEGYDSQRLIRDGLPRHAVFNQKKTGIYFFTASLVGREAYGRGRSLTMWESVYVPIENGYETGRATIGAVTGSPELLASRFQEFFSSSYHAGKDRTVASGPRVLVKRSGDADPDMDKAAVLVLDLEEWKPVGRIKSNWTGEADYKAIEQFVSTCDKLRKRNPLATLSLSTTPDMTDALHLLGVADQIEIRNEPEANNLKSP